MQPGPDRADVVLTSADGTHLVVRRIGRGRPVVFLHGSGGGLHSWADVARRLGDEFTVWTPARRGHGPSDVPPGPASFAREVDDVRAVLDAARRESGQPVPVVGHSYGAVLALHAARASAVQGWDAVPALALFEPPLYAVGPGLLPALAEYRRLVRARCWREADRVFAEQVARIPSSPLAAEAEAATGGSPGTGGTGLGVPDPAERVRAAAGKLHDLEALARDDPDPGRWADVEVPVLLLQGGRTWDPMPATLDYLAAVLPCVERVVWQHLSHLTTGEDPDLVADTLRNFLRRNGSGPEPGSPGAERTPGPSGTTATGPGADDLREVVSRERQLLDPRVRADRGRVEALLHPELREFGRSGRVWDRASLVAALAGDAQVSGSAGEFEPVRLAEDVILLTYRVFGPEGSLRSSVWVRDGAAGWRIRFHQGTGSPTLPPPGTSGC